MRSLLAVYILLAATLQETTLACSCLGPITIEGSLERAETAVFATVSQLLNPNGDQFSSRYYRATADRVIKGCGLTNYRQFYIKTGANSAICGVDLNTQTRYVLFGTVTNEPIDGFVRSPQPVLSINLCQAHTARSNVDHTTTMSLQRRPRPVCWDTDTTTCFQHRDCWRTHGFRGICNAGVCSTQKPPTRPPLPAPTPPSRTYNCKSCPNGYYDGCNTCSCDGNGFPSRCTQIACSFYGRPSCRNRRPNPTTNINCRTCPSGYYDGCNTCSCRPDGTPGFCTQRYCYRPGTPRCRRTTVRDTPVIIAPAAVNCQTCPNGYFDGCNSCRCGANSIVGACTRRACPGGNIRPPSCN